MTLETNGGWRSRNAGAGPTRAARRSRDRLLARFGRLAGIAALLSAAFLLAACNLVGPPQPTGFDYTGTWRGTVVDATHGAGTFVATLEQSGFALSGTWHSVIADDPGRQDGGAWSGQVYTGESGDLLEVTLTPAASGQCSFKLTLSRQQEAIRGDYAPTGGVASCVNLERGTLQLSRQ